MRIAIFFGALTVGLFFAIELAAGHYGPQVGKRFLERSTNYSAESLRDWVTAAPASARSYAFLVLFPLDLMFMLALGGFLGYGSLSSAESVDALRKPDPALRQRSHAGLNKGEASNALRRAVFFHRQGEIRDRTFENQSFRASGLSLITAAIVHWNTVYLDRAVRQLRAQGADVPDDLLAHVAPLGWEHIGLAGD